jgi:hypothetical protein
MILPPLGYVVRRAGLFWRAAHVCSAWVGPVRGTYAMAMSDARAHARPAELVTGPDYVAAFCSANNLT